MKRKTATACEQHSPANIGNGGENFRCLPPAKLELRKWNGNFYSNRLEKVEYLGRSSVCSGKFPLKPEISPEWKAPQVLLKGFAITIRMNRKINDCVVAQIT